jgi:signal transduction histidine kinase
MIKKIAILILMFLFANPFYGQNKDNALINSLKIELNKTKEDTSKVKILNQLSFLLFETETKHSLRYAYQGLQLAEKLQWKRGMGVAYNNLGLCYWSNSNFPESLKNYYQAHKINDSLNNESEMALTHNGLGLVFFGLEDFKKASYHFKKALSINEKLKIEKEIPNNLNNIATIYSINKDFAQSLKYYHLAIEHYAKQKDTINIAYCYTNIGNVFIQLKKYQESIKVFNKSIAYYNNDNSLYNGYNKVGLGRAYYFLSLGKTNKGDIDYLLNQSLKNINEAIISFKTNNNPNSLPECYRYYSKVYQEKKDFKKAVLYYKKSTTINNSIYSNNNSNKITALNIQKEAETYNNQLILKELKLKTETTLVQFIFAITSTVVILLGLFSWLFISKRKNNLELQKKNATISTINKQKDKFFSIIAHDLRGPFNGFLGLTELLAEEIDAMEKEEIQFAAATMRSSAINLNRLLENLLEWSRMEQGLIRFDPKENELSTVVTECVITLQDPANKKDIKINTDIPENTFVFADTNILQAVIRNLSSNAVKFTPDGGTILIQAKEDDKSTTISIKDTGIGMNKKMIDNLFRLDVQTNRKGTNDEPSTGLGLILCKEFVEKHGGKIWVESEEGQGSTFYVSFPKNRNTLV